MTVIDRLCKSRFARDNRGCYNLCRFLGKGWLYGARLVGSMTDLQVAEYHNSQMFRIS